MAKISEAVSNARPTCNKAQNIYVKQNFTENDGSKKNKKFYSFIKAKRSDILGVSPLVDSGVTRINDKKLSELLSDQLASIFSCDDGVTPEVQSPRGSTIVDITFTTKVIVKLLKGFNSEKASGSHKISSWVLKECANEVGDLLVLPFSASFAQGTIPEEWRHAIMIPVYKGNIKNWSKTESSRPINLTSVACKHMEHIQSHIMNHLDKGQTLSETQHGFRKFSSCETQLLETTTLAHH